MKKPRLTEDAIKHHEELFPNQESRLQKTDPEFIEFFDNWAFDEVIRQSKLDTRTRVLVILASTIASHAFGEYRVTVGAALNVGLTPVEIKEVLYQSVSYIGVAKVLDFLPATNEVLQSRGVSLPLAGQPTTTRATRQRQSTRHSDFLRRQRGRLPREFAVSRHPGGHRRVGRKLAIN